MFSLLLEIVSDNTCTKFADKAIRHMCSTPLVHACAVLFLTVPRLHRLYIDINITRYACKSGDSLNANWSKPQIDSTSIGVSEVCNLRI